MKTNRITQLVAVASMAFMAVTAKADYQILFNTFNNTSAPSASTNPVFDVGGTTRLTGTAQWVGRLFDGSTALGTASAPFSDAGPGFIIGGTITVVDSAITSTTSKTFQFKVWNSANGATFDVAQAAGGKVGSAALNLAVVGYVGGTTPPLNVVVANNFSSFSVAAVPEPATVALGLFGAAGLLFRRRK